MIYSIFQIFFVIFLVFSILKKNSLSRSGQQPLQRLSEFLPAMKNFQGQRVKGVILTGFSKLKISGHFIEIILIYLYIFTKWRFNATSCE